MSRFSSMNQITTRALPFFHACIQPLVYSSSSHCPSLVKLGDLVPSIQGKVSAGRFQGRVMGLRAQARRGFLSEVKKIREEEDAAYVLEFDSPLKIVEYPDPRLRATNKRVKAFDEKLKKLAEEMFDVMYKTDGVGLSAPQVGVNVRLMVFNPAGERGKGEELILVNPKVYKYSKKRKVFLEGCLSFPEIYADVERPISVKVDAWDITGKKFTFSLKEFHARIFQHEYDHLEGILFFERMNPEVLETICPALEALEQKYESRTGMPAPETIKGHNEKLVMTKHMSM